MVDRRPQSSAREEFAPGGLVGESHEITLDHIIVSARDKDTAARLFAGIFGLRVAGSGGHFARVRVNDTLTLDFADATGTIAGQHYAFRVSDAEFDAILQRSRTLGSPSEAGPGALKTESSTVGMAAAAPITKTTTITLSS